MDVLTSPKYASGYLGSEAIFHGCFFKKVLLKISQKSETPVPEPLPNKVAGSASSTLAQVFPVNLEKFSLTPFFLEYLKMAASTGSKTVTIIFVWKGL